MAVKGTSINIASLSLPTNLASTCAVGAIAMATAVHWTNILVAGDAAPPKVTHTSAIEAMAVTIAPCST